ncbi:unnamed protein product, partial [Effrenium voratum]
PFDIGSESKAGLAGSDGEPVPVHVVACPGFKPRFTTGALRLRISGWDHCANQSRAAKDRQLHVHLDVCCICMVSVALFEIGVPVFCIWLGSLRVKHKLDFLCCRCSHANAARLDFCASRKRLAA